MVNGFIPVTGKGDSGKIIANQDRTYGIRGSNIQVRRRRKENVRSDLSSVGDYFQVQESNASRVVRKRQGRVHQDLLRWPLT